MKKIFWMLCSMTVLFAAGCESDKTEDEGPVGEARITSFVFSAEKNADFLLKDYTGTITDSKISVQVPAGTDVSSLIATFEVEQEGTVVTVNGTEQVSGTTANDFSVAVDYLVTFGKKNALYTVTVGELPEATWQKVSETELATNEFRMAIDPTDNQPGFAIQVRSEEDAQGPILYAKLDGSSLSSETAYAGNSNYLAFGYNKSGQPYIFFQDYVETSSERAGAIVTYTGGKWNRENVTTQQPNVYVGHAICDVDGKMFVFSSNNKAGTNVPRREINMTTLSGGAWTTDQAIPNRPLNRGYWPIAYEKDNTLYLMVSNPASPMSVSFYKYANNTWSTILEAYSYPSASGDGTFQDFPIKGIGPNIVADDEGNIYAAVSYMYSPQVLKINAATQEVSLVGSAIAPVGSIAGRYCRVAISPLGKLYLVYKKADDAAQLQVVSLDDTTKDWGAPVQISTDEAEDFDIKFAPDGTAYLAYTVSNDIDMSTGTVITPGKLVLYKLATAE